MFLPCDEYSDVMVRRMSVTLRIEVFLPGTEAVESRISMVNDLQAFLKIHKSSSKVKAVIVSTNSMCCGLCIC